MGANTAIGEVGLYGAGIDPVILRPSLRAMTSLGDGRALVELFAFVHGGPVVPPGSPKRAYQRAATEHFFACCDVIAACADGADVTPYTGSVGERYGTWRAGQMPTRDVVVIARHLLEHGLSGVKRHSRGGTPVVNSSQYQNEIYPAEYAAQAIAHLGMSEADAWNQTMTGLGAALRSKFDPEGKRDNIPTEEEHDHVMSWLEAINAQRDAHLRGAE